VPELLGVRPVIVAARVAIMILALFWVFRAYMMGDIVRPDTSIQKRRAG